MWKAPAQTVGAPATAATRVDGINKVKKTIGWYNQHGNLKKPIIYKTVKDVIEKVQPRTALRILKTFEEKANTIENPTYWLQKAALNEPDLDEKVRKTIGWYNSHGNLLEPIKYPEVVEDLGKLSKWEQLQIINQLEEKGKTITNPTAWICKAAQKHARSGKGDAKSTSSQKWGGKGSGEAKKGWKKKW
eukprot:TRINITY_DN4991_c0_g1_i1.p1 TRINITY_DN4991_c0_g1~~TRINITY_DN4991_c0_g1_i1.p1  ORF type:complete len:189 (-),score=40.57 TRINITY_DN4991_c0_g1_i1:101-667(-)